jgi:hypothetical protein
VTVETLALMLFPDEFDWIKKTSMGDTLSHNGRKTAARRAMVYIAVAIAYCLAWQSASAQKTENPIAVFAALDKVTARISPLEIRIGDTVRFGALTVTPRVCYSRPPTEPPLTSVFVEVDEIKLSGEQQRIFTGWMFAQSPGLHAVEHPVFDVWLTNCKTSAPAQSAGSLEKSPAPNRASSNRR